MIQQENNYSLWLRPSQPQIDELTKIISNLAHRFGTIPFPPHITLLSPISGQLEEIGEICEKIVTQEYAFELSLTEIDYSKNYYRNLYILAHLDKNLSSLYRNCKKFFKHESNEPFIPHVSLLYGNLSNNQQQTLQAELANAYTKIFKCQRLDLYNTNDQENQWYLVDSFYLRSSE